MTSNEFLDPNLVIYHVLHIAVLKKITEIYKPLNPIWPPAAILNPGFIYHIQDVHLVSF